MDRLNEVKHQLKDWEQEFFKQHQRKPNKEDIDQAAEDTRRLYKEYRHLKQVRENTKSDESRNQSQHEVAPEPKTTQEESNCWGTHLNRKAMPVPAPRLTSQERENLRASSQYYGLKLKANLAALGKDKPVSPKKSRLSGRVPLRFSKPEPNLQTNTSNGTATKAVDDKSNLFSPTIKRYPCSPFSTKLHPEEPEEQFEAFETKTLTTSTSRINSSYISDSKDKDNESPLNSICLDNSTTSAGLSSSPQGTVRTLNEDVKKTKELEDNSGSIDDKMINSETSLRGTESETFIRFKAGTLLPVGFRDGQTGRPSPASRLSCVDRKWLERCQVFGEMVAEERPGAGNQEVKLKQKEKKENEAEVDQNAEKYAGEKIKASGDSVSQKTFETQTKDKMEETAEEKEDEEQKRKAVPLVPLKDEENSKPGPRRKGKKRQREGDDIESDATGGEKKRQRKSKTKEESSSTNDTSMEGREEKKKRAKKKSEAEDCEEEKDTKAKKQVAQENLLGEIDEEFGSVRINRTLPPKTRATKCAEGNFVKINLKKKSHVKGYALRGIALRKQMYMQKFQLKGERFGGGGGYFGRGRRGGFRGGFSRPGDTCYKCGGSGHWAIHCKGPAPPPSTVEEKPLEEEPFELPTLEDVARATGTLQPLPLGSPCANEEESQQKKQLDANNQDEMLLNVIRPDYERLAPPPPMEPLYNPTHDGKVQETPEEVYAALKDLGYESFRPGQEEPIMRILSGLSTLVVLSTGMGKSLCYQLPAYLYAQRSKCITLVISPLVSLMDDQLSGVPTKLRAACIHSNMTMKQREAAIEKVKSGQVCVLLLSPEALVGGGGSGAGCLPSAHDLPPVAFACIDEAHCVSEWSHNFRPCYLRLCKVLRERLGVQCLLGLTATATLATAFDIAHHLDINDQDGIAVRSAAVPSNLNLSVSMDKEKDEALVCLLKGDRFGCLDSIIVYCTRREETVRVAALLRTCLQRVLVKENNQISSDKAQNNPAGQKRKEMARKKIRKPLKWQAESYHAGLSGSERRRVQNNFMCGELRIVVATVAFGMGLDKPDVRGIVHYNMPKSFESYVQEIGRAGRDGEPAHCHLFLDPQGADLHELRRHIYADTVDRYTIKKLVQKVFPSCKCKKIHKKQHDLWKEIDDSELVELMEVCDQEDQFNQSTHQENRDKNEAKPAEAAERVSDESAESSFKKDKKEEDEADVGENEDKDVDWLKDETADWPSERVCHTHERAIPIQETVEALDISEEGVETLLCYLELHPQRFVELLHPTLSVCKVSCYNGPRQLQKITKICPPVAVVLARRRMGGEPVERLDQVEFDVVELADTMGWQLPLVKRGLRQLQWSTDAAGGRSGILVEFSSPSFYFRSYGDLSDEEMDRVCDSLHKRVQAQERAQLFQLTSCFKAFKSVAFQSVSSCVDHLDESRSFQLKQLLSDYFDKRRDREHMQQPVELEELAKYKLMDWESQIRADIRSFLSNRSDEKFSGRAVARIFHGIGSPCYPAQIYGKDRRYWRRYIQFDFNQLIRLATQEIIQFK